MRALISARASWPRRALSPLKAAPQRFFYTPAPLAENPS